MNISPRQRDILAWLQETQQLGTEQLAARFQVSPQTIRRDVQAPGGVRENLVVHRDPAASQGLQASDAAQQRGRW